MVFIKQWTQEAETASLFFFGRPACDIAISGLGWIGIEHATKQLEITDSKDSEEASGELHLAVHVPKPVEVFMRPAMPVGNAGKEWYEYRELTDREEELRPKWYFWCKTQPSMVCHQFCPSYMIYSLSF